MLVPGEPEAEAERRAADRGVILDEEHHRALEALASRFGVPLPAATSI
ncbi:hypothetical protein BH24CHL9_BH24CHL9_01560 [soil metagenome]